MGKEHSCPLHISDVTFPEAIDHPAFFVFGEKIIQEKHDCKEHECQEPRPHDRQPQSRQPKPEVLGMANDGIKSFCCDPLLEQLPQIHLKAQTRKISIPMTKNTDPKIRMTVNTSFGGTTM